MSLLENGHGDGITKSANGDLLEASKRSAAYYAVTTYVKSGHIIGVGTGSTAKYVVLCLAELYTEKKLTDIKCVPTSFESRRLIIANNLPLSDLSQTPALDVCIDGADECDAQLNCIKGGGGALTQEKCVMFNSEKFYVIGDYLKRSNKLGDRFEYVPIEVLQLAYVPVSKVIEKNQGGKAILRMAKMKAGPVVTDNGNFILDWYFDKECTYNWMEVNQHIKMIPGIVETGLFLNCVTAAFFGMADGSVCGLYKNKSANGHNGVGNGNSANECCTSWGGITVSPKH